MTIKIHRRAEWKARPPKSSLGTLQEPVGQAFIHTSVTLQLAADATIAEEAEQMRRLQEIAFARGFLDVSYSFGVFPSGRIWEGRGRGKEQAATLGYNTTSYSIVTVGNTDAFPPTRQQLHAIRDLIDTLQKRGAITKHVDVRGHREVAPKACPGARFSDEAIAQLQREVNDK